MEEYGFPDLEEHRKVHYSLIESVEEMKEKATSGTEDLAKELLKFLRIWALDTLLKSIKGMVPFLMLGPDDLLNEDIF